MNVDSRSPGSFPEIPVDMVLATVGITVLLLPGASVLNESLAFVITRDQLFVGVVAVSFSLSPFFSAGYLSLNRLWSIDLVFLSCVIVLAVSGSVAFVVLGVGGNTTGQLSRIVALTVSYLVTGSVVWLTPDRPIF